MNQIAQWQSMPFINKSLVIISLSVFIITILFYDLKGLVFRANDIEQLRLWTLFSSLIFQGGFVSLIVNLCALQDLSQAEKRVGSIVFIFDIFLKNAMGMIIVYLLYKGSSFLFEDNRMSSAHFGLWNIGIYYIVLRAMRAPNDETQVLFLPFVMKSKFYAVGLLFLTTIFPTTQITTILFALLAIIEHVMFGKGRFRLGKSIAEKIESKVPGRFVQRQDFVLFDHAQEMMFQGTQRIEFQMENFQKQVDQSPVSNPSDKVNTDDDSMQLK